MNKRRIIGLISILTLILATSGCGGTSQADIDATVAVNVSAAQTMVVQTMNALASITPTDTITPEFTATATLEPTDEFTPTPEGVFLTVTKDTNCRVGPSTSFASLTTIKVGDRVQVVGTNPGEDTYYVKNPNVTGSSYCWLWGRYATLEGDASTLPIFTPQPTPTATYTPTPKTDIIVSFVDMESCSGEYYFRFYIINNGSTTWQSINISVLDQTSSVSVTHTLDRFQDYSGCTAGQSQGDLMQGEYSYVATINPGQFSYDPNDHSIAATILVCSAKSLGGTCMSKTVNFTP